MGQKYAPVGPRQEIVYDTAAGIVGPDADTSKVVSFPDWVTVEGTEAGGGITAGTTVDIQMRVTPQNEWQTVAQLTSTSTAAERTPEISKPFPDLRFVRTGAADVKVGVAWLPRPGI